MFWLFWQGWGRARFNFSGGRAAARMNEVRPWVSGIQVIWGPAKTPRRLRVVVRRRHGRNSVAGLKSAAVDSERRRMALRGKNSRNNQTRVVPSFLLSAEALFDGGKALVEHRLRVRRVVDAPLHEVSGICLRRGRNGRMSLIAVGDRMSKIAWFSLPGSDDGRIDWHTDDIAKLSGSMVPQDDPQIEAVCADGLRRVLLLQETPPRVELIDPKALRVVASIDLAMEGRGEIARAWSDPEGSRGEGMVLLPGGHLSSPRRRNQRLSLSLARPMRSRGA